MTVYLVYNKTNSKFAEIGQFNDTPRKGVLLMGDFATPFKTKRSANRAIQRSYKYARAHNFSWGKPENNEIVKVRLQGVEYN